MYVQEKDTTIWQLFLPRQNDSLYFRVVLIFLSFIYICRNEIVYTKILFVVYLTFKFNRASCNFIC